MREEMIEPHERRVTGVVVVARVEQRPDAWPPTSDGADHGGEVEDLLLRVERRTGRIVGCRPASWRARR
jgi:hypothetical protein